MRSLSSVAWAAERPLSGRAAKVPMISYHSSLLKSKMDCATSARLSEGATHPRRLDAGGHELRAEVGERAMDRAEPRDPRQIERRRRFDRVGRRCRRREIGRPAAELRSRCRRLRLRLTLARRRLTLLRLSWRTLDRLLSGLLLDHLVPDDLMSLIGKGQCTHAMLFDLRRVAVEFGLLMLGDLEIDGRLSKRRQRLQPRLRGRIEHAGLHLRLGCRSRRGRGRSLRSRLGGLHDRVLRPRDLGHRLGVLLGLRRRKRL